MEQKQIRAVLFDCDGVIINSAADIADAVNATLKAHGMRTVSYAKMRTFVGNGSVALIERAIKKFKEARHRKPSPDFAGAVQKNSRGLFTILLFARHHKNAPLSGL